MTAALQAMDLSFLRGKRVDQICIGLYQLQIRLSEEVCISIERDFQHKNKGQATGQREELSSRGATLISLLGKTVERVVMENEKSVTIQFSNSELLTIFVEGGAYESLTVTAPGINIVA